MTALPPTTDPAILAKKRLERLLGELFSESPAKKEDLSDGKSLKENFEGIPDLISNSLRYAFDARKRKGVSEIEGIGTRDERDGQFGVKSIRVRHKDAIGIGKKFEKACDDAFKKGAPPLPLLANAEDELKRAKDKTALRKAALYLFAARQQTDESLALEDVKLLSMIVSDLFGGRIIVGYPRNKLHVKNAVDALCQWNGRATQDTDGLMSWALLGHVVRRSPGEKWLYYNPPPGYLYSSPAPIQEFFRGLDSLFPEPGDSDWSKKRRSFRTACKQLHGPVDGVLLRFRENGYSSLQRILQIAVKGSIVQFELQIRTVHEDAEANAEHPIYKESGLSENSGCMFRLANAHVVALDDSKQILADRHQLESASRRPLNEYALIDYPFRQEALGHRIGFKTDLEMLYRLRNLGHSSTSLAFAERMKPENYFDKAMGPAAKALIRWTVEMERGYCYSLYAARAWDHGKAVDAYDRAEKALNDFLDRHLSNLSTLSKPKADALILMTNVRRSLLSLEKNKGLVARQEIDPSVVTVGPEGVEPIIKGLEDLILSTANSSSHLRKVLVTWPLEYDLTVALASAWLLKYRLLKNSKDSLLDQKNALSYFVQTLQGGIVKFDDAFDSPLSNVGKVEQESFKDIVERFANSLKRKGSTVSGSKERFTDREWSISKGALAWARLWMENGLIYGSILDIRLGRKIREDKEGSQDFATTAEDRQKFDELRTRVDRYWSAIKASPETILKDIESLTVVEIKFVDTVMLFDMTLKDFELEGFEPVGSSAFEYQNKLKDRLKAAHLLGDYVNEYRLYKDMDKLLHHELGT